MRSMYTLCLNFSSQMAFPSLKKEPCLTVSCWQLHDWGIIHSTHSLVTCSNPQPEKWGKTIKKPETAGSRTVSPAAMLSSKFISVRNEDNGSFGWWHHPVVQPGNYHWLPGTTAARRFRSCWKPAENCSEKTPACRFNPDTILFDRFHDFISITDDAAQVARQIELCSDSRERKEGERQKTGVENKKEGLVLPRRACFILGLSMVTVAVLLPLTETWLHPSVHTLLLTHTLHLSQPRPLHPLSASLFLITAFSCSDFTRAPSSSSSSVSPALSH